MTRANLKNLFILLVTFLALGALWYFNNRRVSMPAGSLKGEQSPYFNLVSVNREAISPESFQGRFIMLYFFSGSCPTCRESLPELWRLQEEWQGEGLSLIMVSIEGTETLPYLETVPEGREIYLAADSRGEAAEVFRVKLLPTAFLINPESRILDVFVGVHNFQETGIRSRIERHFRE